MREPRLLTTLWASTVSYRASLKFLCQYLHREIWNGLCEFKFEIYWNTERLVNEISCFHFFSNRLTCKLCKKFKINLFFVFKNYFLCQLIAAHKSITYVHESYTLQILFKCQNFKTAIFEAPGDGHISQITSCTSDAKINFKIKRNVNFKILAQVCM
jgi:hypothetical protein